MMRDGGNPQLFDLANDLGETRNLASQHPEVVSRMRKALQGWNQSLPAPPSVPASASSTEHSSSGF